MVVRDGQLRDKEENVGDTWYVFMQIMQIKVIKFIKMRLFYMVISFLRGYEMSCISKKIISYTHILTNRHSIQ